MSVRENGSAQDRPTNTSTISSAPASSPTSPYNPGAQNQGPTQAFTPVWTTAARPPSPAPSSSPTSPYNRDAQNQGPSRPANPSASPTSPFNPAAQSQSPPSPFNPNDSPTSPFNPAAQSQNINTQVATTRRTNHTGADVTLNQGAQQYIMDNRIGSSGVAQMKSYLAGRYNLGIESNLTMGSVDAHESATALGLAAAGTPAPAPNREDNIPGSSGYQPPRDTRTQQQKIADMNRSLASAKQAAAGGNPGPLQDFDRMFSVTRDPREYKRAFYADYSSDKLSSATETEIRNWFAGQDANNDGLIQTSEMTDNARNLVGGYAGADNALSAAEGVSYHVGKIGNMDAKLDASGLPEPTKREIRSWFIGLDKNNDGAVSSSEMGAPALAINTEAGYMGDNSLSLDEAIAYHKNRQVGMNTKLANSGLSRETQGHIRDYFLANDANKDGHLTQGEMAHPNHWVVNGSAITQDGKYTLEESINLHRGREGKRALTNEEIAGTALSFGNDTPTTALEPVTAVTQASAPVIPVESDSPTPRVIDNGGTGPDLPEAGVIPSPAPTATSGHAIRSDGNYFGAPRFVATAADGTELKFIEQNGRNTGKYYLHKGRPVDSIEDTVDDYHMSIGLNADGTSASATSPDSTNETPMAVHTTTPTNDHPTRINGPAQVVTPDVARNRTTPAVAAPRPKTNDQLLAASGLSTARKNEIKTWWNGQDANKDNFIQKNEMGAYAQKENATALADGKLTMQEAIKYHQDRDLAPKPTAIGKVVDSKPVPTASAPAARPKATAVVSVKPATDDELLTHSGLSTARKNEIKTWWNGQDANKDGFIQKNEMGAYAQKENATALADGKLSMKEAISYHQKRDGVKPSPKYIAAAAYGGRGTTTGSQMSSMPAAGVRPTNNATGFSANYR